MLSIDDGMYNPAMYQDIGMMSSGMYSPYMYPGMFPMYGTIAPVKMHQEPMTDKYETIAKKDKETKSTFKSVAKALFWMALGGFIPPARKYIKNSGGLRNVLTQAFSSLGKLFKKTP